MSETVTQVLLVEDSRGDAILFQRYIAQAFGTTYVVKPVQTLSEALRELAVAEFGVVMLDLGLPDASDLNGLLAIQSTAPQVPVVILTGLSDEQLALRAVEKGAQDYLFKDKANAAEIKRSLLFAIQRKQFQNTLTTLANFDALTGLANRPFFENRLSMALERGKRLGNSIGVFFLDLDGFKKVNDTLGHAAGDQLLVEIAKRLTQSIRPYDLAARFGGDEFALLVEGIKASQDCEVVARKTISLVKEPIMLGAHPVHVGVSIGIATCLAGEPYEREDLLKFADHAMYAAKTAGGSNYVLHQGDKGSKAASG